MPYAVAKILEDWLAEEPTWEASAELVVWSRLFDTDLERAWTECGRADWLTALAGACEAPAVRVATVACDAAGEALTLLPKAIPAATRALTTARALLVGDALDPKQAVAIQTLTARIVARFEKAVAAQPRHRERAEKAYQGALRGIVDVLRGPLGRARGARAEARVLAAVLAHASVVRMRARTTAFHQSLVEAQVLRAATGALVAACAADIAQKASALPLDAAESPLLPVEARVALAALARTFPASRRGAFMEAAVVFESSARAFGAAECASEGVFLASIKSMIKYIRGTLSPVPVEPDPRGPQHILGVTLERTTEQKRRAYARRLRKHVPFAALSPPMSEEDREAATVAAILADPRGKLLSALEHAMASLRAVSATPPTEAFELVKGILLSTGPLDKGHLATALATLSERLAALFDHHAALAVGETREIILQAAAAARASMVDLREHADADDRLPN